MNIFILDIFMYQKPSDLGCNLSYQQVVLFESKLGEETLLFYTQICIMTLPPIFTSLCFVFFFLYRGKQITSITLQNNGSRMKVSPKQGRKTEYLLCSYAFKGCKLLK